MSAGDEGLGIEWPDVPGLPPGYVEIEAERHLSDEDDDLPTLDEVAEEADEARWEVLEAGLVSLLDALGDVVARFDKLDARLDVIAGRLSDLEAAVEAEAGRPRYDPPPGAVWTKEQADAVATDVLGRMLASVRAQQRRA